MTLLMARGFPVQWIVPAVLLGLRQHHFSGSRLPRVAKGRVQGGLWMLAKIAHAAAVAELALNGAIAEPFAAPVTVVLQSRP
jgi:hypothetical protein